MIRNVTQYVIWCLGEVEEKKGGFQIKRLKLVQEPNKPVEYIPHPVKVPEVLRNAEFDAATELGAIYAKFKDRAVDRFGELNALFVLINLIIL